MAGEVLDQVARASMLGHQGDRDGARTLLAAAWARAADGPAVLRCAVAHALADVQDDLDAELRWDERALDEAGLAAAEPTPEGLPPVAALLPSLHLNLADVHRRRGDARSARAQVAAARSALGGGPEGAEPDGAPPQPAQPHIAAALDRIEAALGALRP